LHRDIKPENLVLDERGYVRITDFGIAKVYQKENSSETSGTPGYMSPEVMCAQNHTQLVDYFAVGVIGYEFLSGRVNFKNIIIEILTFKFSIFFKN
jgi:serine/threonine protein kinase